MGEILTSASETTESGNVKYIQKDVSGKDEKVKVVLINIFGGITRCDDVAIGLIQSFEQIKSEIPIIVRLTGTNENIGRDLLRNHSRFQIATTMQEAALMAIKS